MIPYVWPLWGFKGEGDCMVTARLEGDEGIQLLSCHGLAIAQQ